MPRPYNQCPVLLLVVHRNRHLLLLGDGDGRHRDFARRRQSSGVLTGALGGGASDAQLLRELVETLLLALLLEGLIAVGAGETLGARLLGVERFVDDLHVLVGLRRSGCQRTSVLVEVVAEPLGGGKNNASLGGIELELAGANLGH